TLGEGADCRIIRIAQKLDTHAFALIENRCEVFKARNQAGNASHFFTWDSYRNRIFNLLCEL
ncbi:hypothetical protein ACR2VI_25905, partial [Klebsiella pneumoniae]